MNLTTDQKILLLKIVAARVEELHKKHNKRSIEENNDFLHLWDIQKLIESELGDYFYAIVTAVNKKIKVYGWTDMRSECPGSRNQTREIIAANSKAAAARAAGYDKPSKMWNLCETQNDGELVTALNKPGVVFWKPLSDSQASYIEGAKKK